MSTDHGSTAASTSRGNSTDNFAAIRTAFERNEAALRNRPTIGIQSGCVTTRLDTGLACEVQAGPWRVRTDMPEKVGGTATGPRPGHLVAASLGSCLAVMIRLWSAKLDVPIESIEVEVHYEADARVLFGIEGVPPRWRDIRYHVHVESDAPEADVRRVIDLAHEWSHVRGDLEHPFRIDREIEITSTTGTR